MPARRVYLLAAVVFAWLSLALQLYLTIGQSTSNGMTQTEAVIRFLSFFTVTTNIIVAVLLTSALLRFPAQSPRPAAISAGTAYIIVVGITYFSCCGKPGIRKAHSCSPISRCITSCPS